MLLTRRQSGMLGWPEHAQTPGEQPPSSAGPWHLRQRQLAQGWKGSDRASRRSCWRRSTAQDPAQTRTPWAQHGGARSGAKDDSSAQHGGARSGAKEDSSTQPAASKPASNALRDGRGTARGVSSTGAGSKGTGSQAGSRSHRAGAVKQTESFPAGRPAKAAPGRQAGTGTEVAAWAAGAPKEVSMGQRTLCTAMESGSSKAIEPKSGSSAAQGSQQSRSGKRGPRGQPAGQRAMARAAAEGRDQPKQLLSKAVREAQACNASAEKPASRPAKQLSKAASEGASRPRKEVVTAPPGLGT